MFKFQKNKQKNVLKFALKRYQRIDRKTNHNYYYN